MQYRLTYKYPHEVDDDSPDGIGDHYLVWSVSTKTFEAESDSSARAIVLDVLAEPVYSFSHHIPSPQFVQFEKLERVPEPVSVDLSGLTKKRLARLQRGRKE